MLQIIYALSQGKHHASYQQLLAATKVLQCPADALQLLINKLVSCTVERMYLCGKWIVWNGGVKVPTGMVPLSSTAFNSAYTSFTIVM